MCYGKNKRELLDKYNNLTKVYTHARESASYKKYIERYEQLKKEVSV